MAHKIPEVQVSVGRFTASAFAGEGVWRCHKWDPSRPGSRLPVASFTLRRRGHLLADRPSWSHGELGFDDIRAILQRMEDGCTKRGENSSSGC